MHVLTGLGWLPTDDLGTVEAEVLAEGYSLVIALVGLDALKQADCTVLVVTIVPFVQTLSDYFSRGGPDSLGPSNRSLVC